MARADGLDGLGVLRLPVLDVLRFVQHRGVEFQAAIMFGVAPEQSVAGDEQIVGRNLGKEAAPLGAMQGQHAQARGEFSRLGFPIEHQRGRADDQRRAGGPCAALLEGAQVGQHLHRLA